MGLFAKFASVGGATMASRVLGFVREALIAAFLGAGPVADAFYAAFRFPNLFRRLFAEGAFNSAFIPLFSAELENGGRDAARAFAEKILSVLLVVLLVLSAVAMLFMPFLVGTVIAPSFSDTPDKFDLTILLTRVMFPYLAAMSLVAMFSGILNAFRKYFLAALAPVILNVVLILVLIGGHYAGLSEANLGIAMAWGVFCAGFLQLVMLVAGVAQQGFGLSLKRPRLSPPVRRLLVLAVPTAIAGGITQINLLVSQIIASAQDGAIAVLNYADRLMQLPLGIVAISIGVVLLPELSRALAANDAREAEYLQNRSIEFGLGLTVPAAVGLFMLPLPLVVLIFERGAFDRATSEITAQALTWFALGLPSFVLIKIFQPAFYARQDMRTPMWFSTINAIVNVILAFILFPRYGVAGLAIATSIAGWANAILLVLALSMSQRFRMAKQTLVNVGLILLASTAMGGVLFLGNFWFESVLLDAGLFVRLASIVALIAVAAIVYFGLVMITGAVPASQVRRFLRR